MKVFRSRYLIIICIALFSVSCGKLFRKTWFEAPQNGLVAIDHTIECKNGAKVQLPMRIPQQVEIQKRGYKTQYAVWYNNKANYWTAIETLVIPISAGIIAKANDEIFLGGVALTWPFILGGLIDLENGPITQVYFDNNLVQLPNFEEAKSNVKVMNVDFKMEATEEYNDSTRYWMNDFCEEVGFTDNDNLDISGYGDYHIYASVVSYHMKRIDIKRETQYCKELYLGVNYSILDKYGTELIDTTITSKSGQFLNNYAEKFCFRDAIDYSMIELFSNKRVQTALMQDKTDAEPSQLIIPNESPEETNISYDVLNASIYKIYTEYGFAPLIPIGKDGLAACSHHAIDLLDTLIIINPTGDTIRTYDILEESYTKDYVLLKLDDEFEQHYTVNYTSNVKADHLSRFDVVAVGFNQYIDALNVIEGKVNNDRKEDNYPIYQLDVNLSDLYFPAIFSSNGQLLGFVSKTIDTRRVEGISFFRPIVDN